MTVIELRPPVWTEPEIPPGHLSSIQICHRAGITYRQLDYWTRTGLLHPTPETHAHGSGTQRHYPLQQLHRAATLRWLLDAGISLQTCRLVIDDLLETGSAHLADALVIHLPDDP